MFSFCHLAVRLSLAPLIAVAAMTSADAEIRYKESSEDHEIGYDIKTKQHIWRALKRIGPVLGGQHVLGSAWGQMGYAYKSRRSGEMCTITEVQVEVNVKIKLPQWHYEFQADQDGRDFFACVRQTVIVHEKRHAEIWYETAQELEDAFLGELQGVRCDAFKARASAIYDRIFKRSRTRQKEFDDDDAKSGNFEKCWQGERNWQTARSLPEYSGRSSWSEASFDPEPTPHAAPNSASVPGSRTDEPQTGRGVEPPESTSAGEQGTITPQSRAEAREAETPIDFDGSALLMLAGTILGVGAAGCLFYAFGMNSAVSLDAAIAPDEENGAADWTKRAISSFSKNPDHRS